MAAAVDLEIAAPSFGRVAQAASRRGVAVVGSFHDFRAVPGAARLAAIEARGRAQGADVVKIACLAQLVNTIAPIMTEPGGKAWVQTIYYPFLYASRFGRGTSLNILIDSPGYACSVGDAIPSVDGAATLSKDENEIALFLVNRSLTQEQDCEISLANLCAMRVIECVTLCGFSAGSRNTADTAPVHPAEFHHYTLRDGTLYVNLPAFSWTMIRMKIDPLAQS